ncbi:hypothetical protein [Alkalicoccus luteus]|uniref:hypothetical protein n=1 Tax=Alkalicoccus luteus TaxID=1237094 RepID=UPI004033F80A
MDLLNVNSIEELKKYGKFKEIKKKLNYKLGNSIKIRARGWTELFEVINDLNCLIKTLDNNVEDETAHILPTGQKGQSQIKKEVNYFKTEVDELIFYLLELDGDSRLDKLGVTSFHYRNRKYANNWRKDLARKLHPDVCKHPKAEEAYKELSKIYEGMGNYERKRKSIDSSS